MAFTFVTLTNLQVNSIDVPTDGVGLSSGGALSTRNAFNCVIILLHAPLLGAGCLAHLSPGTLESPVLVRMVQFLVDRGAAANALDVLIAGASSRETDVGWHAAFSAQLTGAGLALANVHDARSQKGRTDIGGNGRGAIRGVVYRPTTGEVAPVEVAEAANVAAKIVGVNLFTVAANGTATAVVERSKCYVTTATIAALGLPDDCEELETLRWFRDTVLLRDPALQEDVALYYANAPAVVAAIDASPDPVRVYAEIYREGVAPALASIRRGDFPEAYGIYRRAMEDLGRRFLPAQRG